MAKIKQPLFSQTASGSISEKLTFSLRESGQQVRFQKAQKDVLTSSRIIQRAYYTEAVTAWNLLNETEKQSWVDFAKLKQYTGYNLYMKTYIDNLINGLEKAIYGVANYGNSNYGYN